MFKSNAVVKLIAVFIRSSWDEDCAINVDVNNNAVDAIVEIVLLN